MDLAAEEFDDLLDYGHAQPGSGDVAGGVGAVETLANALGLFGRHADAVIDHRDPDVGQFGLHNALMPFGTSFVEVVAPIVEGTT